MTQSAKSRAKHRPKQVEANWEFDAIGTHWRITIFEPIDSAQLEATQQQVAKRIEDFDQTYSRFREDSLITKISRKSGTYTLPDDSLVLFQFYKSLYEATHGVVTPLIGDLLASAGYDASYSLQPGQLHTPPIWEEAMEYENNTLIVHRPVTLDFGAAGKGYLVDIIAELLRERDINGYCIDASGDMVVRGQEKLRVGLEHPDNAEQAVGVATLINQAIAGSAINRRAWSGYHHILNPFTLHPSTGIKATWVVADSTLVADGLATALFFVAPEQLKHFSFEYLIINDNNQYKCSPGFPAELFQD